MHVLLLIDHPIHPHAQRDLDFILHDLDPERIQVHVCSLRDGSPLAQHSLAARSNLDPRAALRLHRLVKSLDIELIHVLENAPLTIAAAVIMLHQFPLLVTLYDMPDHRRDNWLRLYFFRRYWVLMRRLITRLIVHSEIIKRQVWLITNFIRDKIEV